jgi:hypothetical protein
MDHYLAVEDVAEAVVAAAVVAAAAAAAVAAGRPDTIKERAMPLRELVVVRSCYLPHCYFLH